MKKIFILFLLSLIISCKKNDENQVEKKKPIYLFQLKDSTNINFTNALTETEELNPYTYRNFYNGGGVALGDINNDGLLDIYFTGNQVENQLYLNKGNWKFENITQKANVSCKNVWSTGVTFVDINADGFLDIYVCKAGPPSSDSSRHNELFINNGDLSFTEQSKKYGLDITGLSVQANFFDYDKDGDLDCYILNNSIRTVGNYDFIKNQREIPTESGNKLLRNDNGVFVDVTSIANIYSSPIGFGLGITVSDFNNDSWPDIFISNDFFERDYLYINQKNGVFKEDLINQFESISMGSMGADAADLNNDSHVDLMVTEMLPGSIERQRTKTVFDSWNKYEMKVKNGYYYQFSRNALHRNMGNNSFLELSRFSNVAASEWSWASLIFDADNDGLKDIFISNGIYKDLLDRDYLTYTANASKISEMIKNDRKDVIQKLIKLMPSKAVPNVAYKNLGDFQFKNVTANWGLGQPSFSNGSAYGDLDNDGDLDLVVNNINMPSFVYENKTDTAKLKSITIKLKGDFKNTKAIGAKAEIYYNNKYSVLENFPSRGFESSISNNLLFGVGDVSVIDSLKIYWPNGQISKHDHLKTNKEYTYTQPKEDITNKKKKRAVDIKEVFLPVKKGPFEFVHIENNTVDFDRERLLPEMYSNEGPNIASADINKDGNPDFYIGGAKGHSGKLFISKKDKTYTEITEPFISNSKSEDTDAVFFDSDNDGDLDLYVCSGGKSFSKFDFALHDRLYINDGQQNFKLSLKSLKFPYPISTSTVSVYDYDQDGDLDIFIGERFKVDAYGMPSSGYMLLNNGSNNYKFSQPQALNNIGLITDSAWEDINDDGIKDLIVSGEWMPISIFINTKEKLINKTDSYGLANYKGLWKTFKLVDIDRDGDLDIIAGNKGDNTFIKNGTRMYVSDFDGNGSIEQIICHKINNNYYPIVDRDELISQVASLKQKFLYYKDYQDATIETLFDKNQLEKALVFDINTVETSVFIRNNNIFMPQKIPNEIQYSNVEAIEFFDVDNDGFNDIILGGNQYLIKPQFGRQDASHGWVLFGDKENTLKKIIPLNIKGQIRDLYIDKINSKNYLIVTKNNDSLKFYEIPKHK